jgi:hypothetical protein
MMGLRVKILTFGFFPHTQTGKSGGHVQPVQYSLKRSFTILSSREWKVIIAKTPSFLSKSKQLSRAVFKASSSAFTAMRNA